MKRRVLICANPDLNYIDGSSIWAQTIALVFAEIEAVEVDFVTRSTPRRDELFGPLFNKSNIAIIDGSKHPHWKGKHYQRLSLSRMGELAVNLDNQAPYDVILVRGLEIAHQIKSVPLVFKRCWLYLTDILQREEDYSNEQKAEMASLANGCKFLLCQTEGFKQLWRNLVPELTETKCKIYSPVIPDINAEVARVSDRAQKAIYAGKFKADWMTLEMAESWIRVHQKLPQSELIMIGDKIHDDASHPKFAESMKKALETTDGLISTGAMPRSRVQAELDNARVGLSWRNEAMNETIEYSTKILEYGGAGCAAIVNRNPLHEALLGSDYPLFANNQKEFEIQLERALVDNGLTQNAADKLRNLAKKHTFSERVVEIETWLSNISMAPKPKRKIKVLVAGHDLKFFSLLQEKLELTGEFEFSIDQWDGHTKHNESRSRELLQWADVIFCEWCLGNLKWYSLNKLPHQRLIARFHAQEARTVYMHEANWKNIEHISFVSHHTRRKGLNVFKGFPSSKTSVIPNYIDNEKFTAKKKTGEARYTLGMIGVAPKSKRLDKAIDLLELLLEEDSRYILRIKGKHPLEYSWLLKRPDELAYYKAIFERINTNPKLRHNVIFDPPGDNVNDWFTMVGFILSPSEFESFHMAVGEGVLTGATPIVWPWEGASELWGREVIIRSLSEAKKKVISNTKLPKILDKFHQSEYVITEWTKMLSEVQ